MAVDPSASSIWAGVLTLKFCPSTYPGQVVSCVKKNSHTGSNKILKSIAGRGNSKDGYKLLVPAPAKKTAVSFDTCYANKAHRLLGYAKDGLKEWIVYKLKSTLILKSQT